MVAEEHRFLLIVAAAYVTIGAIALGSSVDGAVSTLAATYPFIIIGNSVIIASVAGIWTTGLLVRRRPAHPFAEVARAFGQPDVWPLAVARFLVLVPMSAVVTGTFSAIKSEIPVFHPFSFDPLFISLDGWLHGGLQPWELVHLFLGYPIVTKALDYAYYLWFPILYHTFYWQVFTMRRPVLRLQFVTAFVLCWMLVGSVTAIAFSSAGPVFLAGLGIDDGVFRGLFDYLNNVNSSATIFALTVQDSLWQAYSKGIAMPFEGITAMPSMHVAIAVLLALFGWRRHWLLGIGYTAFAVMIFLGSIHLGFHYAIDGYVAAAMVAAIWWVSGKIARRSLGSPSAALA